MLKIFGAVLLIFSTSKVGMNVASSVEKRIDELRELRNIMILLMGEIDYDMSCSWQAFMNISDKVSEPYREFLKRVSKEAEEMKEDSFAKIWEKHLDVVGKKIKDEEDVKRFKDFGHDFGYKHKEVQISAIKMYINELDIKIEELRKDVNAKMRIYRMLGVMTGIFLVILLV